MDHGWPPAGALDWNYCDARRGGPAARLVAPRRGSGRGGDGADDRRPPGQHRDPHRDARPGRPAHKAHPSLRRSDPAALFLPDLDRLIEPGSLENDLARAAEADWIIEAIIEDLPTKQARERRPAPSGADVSAPSCARRTFAARRRAGETPAE